MTCCGKQSCLGFSDEQIVSIMKEEDSEEIYESRKADGAYQGI
jgi:hypothetical protein